MPRRATSPRSDRGQGPAFQCRAVFLPSSVSSLRRAIGVLLLSRALLGKVWALKQLAESDSNRGLLRDGKCACSRWCWKTALQPGAPGVGRGSGRIDWDQLQHGGFPRDYRSGGSHRPLYYTSGAEDRQNGLTLELLRKVVSNSASLGHQAAGSPEKSSLQPVAISAERVLGSHLLGSLGLQ